MAILIDPPTWPAHGTVFSHLVSDSTYAELHDFARAQHLSPRAFDLDHYDVPAELYDRLVAAGARAVTGNELTRALVASGLRVPLKERPGKIRGTLLSRWDALLPGQHELGEHLLDQWEQPHRTYHNSAHLLEMLTALDSLYGSTTGTSVPKVVQLATWLHDVVYEGVPGQDEARSAEFARDVLTPLVTDRTLTPAEVGAVAELIEASATHAQDEPGGFQREAGLSAGDIAAFFDADFAILAAPAPRYRRYVAGVRQEYAHVSDADFRAARREILQSFIRREFLFTTRVGRQKWEEPARRNIGEEIEELSAR